MQNAFVPIYKVSLFLLFDGQFKTKNLKKRLLAMIQKSVDGMSRRSGMNGLEFLPQVMIRGTEEFSGNFLLFFSFKTPIKQTKLTQKQNAFASWRKCWLVCCS